MKKIDFHAHVLPRCDHGSSSSEMSIRQMTMAAGAGVDLVCATPHFYAEQEDVLQFLQRRSACAHRLCEKLSAMPEVFPELRCGAEVLAFPGIERLPSLNQLCLEGTNLLLLEMPFCAWSDAVKDSVNTLLKQGELQIVLAHAERYDPLHIDDLLRYGAMIQLNVASLNHYLLNKHIRRWITEDCVYAIGSDIHEDGNAYHIWAKAENKQKQHLECIMKKTNDLMSGSRLNSYIQH